jgi:CRP-like cAMP-binding protein
MPMDLLLANKAFDAETTHLLGSTFDAAWERVKASDSLPTGEGHVRSMRELLAKFIIAMVEQGEKDPKRLTDNALLRLRIILRPDAGVDEASKSSKAQNGQVLPDLPPTAASDLRGRFNRFLATLPPHDFSLLAPHLRTIPLERGVMLQDVGEEIEHVYFPHSGMVSLVVVMQSGGTVETATIGWAGVIGASAGLGARSSTAQAVVLLAGTAAWLSAAQFHAAANQSQAIRDLIVRYNDLLLAEVQQSVACNALHALEARLCRWLLQTHDCTDGTAMPLTQELLGQMLGVRRTTVTLAASRLQNAGLIHYRRGHIQILDRPALEDIACECYAAVRHLRMRAFDWDLIRAEALGPAAIRAASTGRTHDRTRPMLHQRKKALVNWSPSTHDPKQS